MPGMITDPVDPPRLSGQSVVVVGSSACVVTGPAGVVCFLVVVLEMVVSETECAMSIESLTSLRLRRIHQNVQPVTDLNNAKPYIGYHLLKTDVKLN